MALRGNLKDFTLPDVFQLITASKKTGVLRITGRDEAQGSVWFTDGDVFFAQSNWHHEKLGDRLVAAQKITPSALARALQVRAEEPEGRRIGRILVDEGYITESVLEAFVQEQIQDTVFDLMRWDEGEFDFEILPEVVDEDIGLTVSIENIIMEGSRRLEEWARIKKKVPSMDIVFRMATAPGEGTFEISLKPVEWNLLLLIDGTRSVSELARATGRTDFEVARIVYGLFSAGLLEVTPEEESRRLLAEREERALKRAALSQATGAAETMPVPAVEPSSAERYAVKPPVAEPSAMEAGGSAEIATAPEPLPEPAAEEAATARQPEPVEVPEFLSAAPITPNADDMIVFEEMVGALLVHPATGAPSEAPEPLVPQQEAELEAVPEVAAEAVLEEVLEAEPQFEAEEVEDVQEAAEIVEVAEAEEIVAVEEAPAAEAEIEAAPAEETELGTAPEVEEWPEMAPIEEPAPEPSPPAETEFAGVEAFVEEVIVEQEEREAVFVEPAAPTEPYVEPAAGPRAPFSEAEEVIPEESAEEGSVPGPEVPIWDLPPAEPMSLLEEYAQQEVPPPAAPRGEPELESVADAEFAVEAPEFEAAEVAPAEVDEVLEAELFAELGIGGVPMVEAAAVSEDEAVAARMAQDESLEIVEAPVPPEVARSSEAAVDARFAGAISDEISALTGFQRQRPTAVVNSLDVGAAKLRRDVAVDRETLLKIIQGIQNL